jgi:hypothetical protein
MKRSASPLVCGDTPGELLPDAQFEARFAEQSGEERLASVGQHPPDGHAHASEELKWPA